MVYKIQCDFLIGLCLTFQLFNVVNTGPVPCILSCQQGTDCRKPSCICPDGFIKHALLPRLCNPICSQLCLNGACTQPEYCACKKGYTTSRENRYECVPKCKKPCQNGSCLSPDKCTCNKGYEPDSKDQFRCNPKCSEGCVNGYCSAPNVCSCRDGYTLEESENKSVCKPICAEACAKERCTRNETCSCNEGYVLDPINQRGCVPKCSEHCQNGTCQFPEKCVCYEGYVRHSEDDYKCVPRFQHGLVIVNHNDIQNDFQNENGIQNVNLIQSIDENQQTNENQNSNGNQSTNENQSRYTENLFNAGTESVDDTQDSLVSKNIHMVTIHSSAINNYVSNGNTAVTSDNVAVTTDNILTENVIEANENLVVTLITGNTPTIITNSKENIPTEYRVDIAKNVDNPTTQSLNADNIAIDDSTVITSDNNATNDNNAVTSDSSVVNSDDNVVTNNNNVVTSENNVATATIATTSDNNVVANGNNVVTYDNNNDSNVVHIENIALTTDNIVVSYNAVASDKSVVTSDNSVASNDINIVAIDNNVVANENNVATSNNTGVTSSNDVITNDNVIVPSENILLTTDNIVAATDNIVAVSDNVVAVSDNVVAVSDNVVAASDNVVVTSDSVSTEHNVEANDKNLVTTTMDPKENVATDDLIDITESMPNTAPSVTKNITEIPLSIQTNTDNIPNVQIVPTNVENIQNASTIIKSTEETNISDAIKFEDSLSTTKGLNEKHTDIPETQKGDDGRQVDGSFDENHNKVKEIITIKGDSLGNDGLTDMQLAEHIPSFREVSTIRNEEISQKESTLSTTKGLNEKHTDIPETQKGDDGRQVDRSFDENHNKVKEIITIKGDNLGNDGFTEIQSAVHILSFQEVSTITNEEISQKEDDKKEPNITDDETKMLREETRKPDENAIIICKDGYILGEGNECIPHCSKTCINSFCSHPDTCTCKTGYEKSPLNDFSCIPSCRTVSCINGMCISPEVCKCYEKFEFNNKTGTCELKVFKGRSLSKSGGKRMLNEWSILVVAISCGRFLNL